MMRSEKGRFIQHKTPPLIGFEPKQPLFEETQNSYVGFSRLSPGGRAPRRNPLSPVIFHQVWA
jgi:hypothetical protein